MTSSESEHRLDETAISRLIAHFDHHDPQFAEEGVPQAVYRRLRAECPVKWTDAHDGFWVVSRYDDIDRVATDPATFSSALGVLVPHGPDRLPDEKKAEMLESGRGTAPPVFFDPPLHGQYRQALAPMFTPAAVHRRADYIQEVTDQFIDAIIPEGRCDIFRDFCAPVPAIVVLDWLGIPTDDWRAWSDAVLHQFENPGHDGPDISAIDVGLVLSTLADRRENPRSDILSALSTATVDGEKLSEYDILRIAMVSAFAGLDTTTNAVASSLVELHRRPELRRSLVEADPGDPLWTSAIEELLRYTCPVQGFRRTSRTPASIGNAVVEPGDRVLMLWASANFDPEVFDDPDEIDLSRANNRHMTFGRGIHRCLGLHLARLEMRIMLQRLLHRIPDYEIDESGLDMHPDAGLVYGYRRVPFAFDVAKVRGSV